MTIPTLRFRFQPNTPRLRARVLPAIPPLQPQFRNNGTHIQWRVGTNDWADLVALTEIEGPMASIVAGDGIDVDATDPVNPTVSVLASANGLSLIAAANYAAMRGLLDLEVGTDVQAYSADLSDLVTRWVPASASGPASLDFLEDADSGTNKVTLSAPSALAADRAIAFPDAAGTIALEGSTVRIVRTQIFTSSGTYTPHANMLYCQIECVGAGGGGGSGTATTNQSFGGGGGGSGGYSRKIASAADIGASQTVTIGSAGSAGSGGGSGGNGGAGGDTSVGSLCIGKGGSGGTRGQFGQQISTGGAGGVAGTGDLTTVGDDGAAGLVAETGSVDGLAGKGGRSAFGGGGRGAATGTGTAAGTAGGNYGGGGGGGASYNSTSTGNGGAGAAGLVIITEFCSA